MVEQPRHCDTLLVASGQRISPFALRIPAALAIDSVGDLNNLENLEEILVRLTACKECKISSVPRIQSAAQGGKEIDPRARISASSCGYMI